MSVDFCSLGSCPPSPFLRSPLLRLPWQCSSISPTGPCHHLFFLHCLLPIPWLVSWCPFPPISINKHQQQSASANADSLSFNSIQERLCEYYGTNGSERGWMGTMKNGWEASLAIHPLPRNKHHFCRNPQFWRVTDTSQESFTGKGICLEISQIWEEQLWLTELPPPTLSPATIQMMPNCKCFD